MFEEVIKNIYIVVVVVGLYIFEKKKASYHLFVIYSGSKYLFLSLESGFSFNPLKSLSSIHEYYFL